jgi:hypothetical protein
MLEDLLAQLGIARCCRARLSARTSHGLTAGVAARLARQRFATARNSSRASQSGYERSNLAICEGLVETRPLLKRLRQMVPRIGG